MPVKEIKCDKSTCLLEMNCKFTKIRLKYYFSIFPSKVMDKYGQVEIETKNSLKLFRILFHFAFFLNS